MPRQQATGQSWVRFGTQPGVLDIPGGIVDFFTAAAALNIGDAVFISAASSVNKSLTAGNQAKVAGIVIGGDLTSYECSDDPNDVGLAAASNGGTAVVLIQGKCYVVADGAIAAGIALCMSTTVAGRVRAFAPLTVTGAPALGTLGIGAGATAVTSTAANGAIITGAPAIGTLAAAGDGANTIFGISRTAAAGAGNTLLALVNAV